MEHRITHIGPGYGAGNPGANNGTGGLLIMCADSIRNNGIISSSGSNGGTGRAAGGGASGGGSINIFYKKTISGGNIYSNGGTGPNAWDYGAKRRQRWSWMRYHRKHLYRNICNRIKENGLCKMQSLFLLKIMILTKL